MLGLRASMLFEIGAIEVHDLVHWDLGEVIVQIGMAGIRHDDELLIVTD